MKINYRRLAQEPDEYTPSKTEQIIQQLTTDDMQAGRDCNWNNRERLARSLIEEGREREAALIRDGHPVREQISQYNTMELVANYPPEQTYQCVGAGLCGRCMNVLCGERAVDLVARGFSELPHPREFRRMVTECAVCEHK